MRRTILAAALALVAGLAASAHAACGWVYPRDLPLVETNVRYWRLPLTLPAGAALEIEGEFPYARQMSFNVHSGVDSRVLAALSDVELHPISGHINPFVEGAARRTSGRTYRATLIPSHERSTEQAASSPTAPNAAAPLRILYRIYLPDWDKPGGGVALPAVTIVDQDGGRTRIAGQDCPDAGSVDPTQTLGKTSIPPGASQVSVPLDWRNAVVRTGSATGDVFVNRDNSYAYALTDIPAGHVLVLSGQSPHFPRTHTGARRLGGGDVRYWSFCAYRHPSDRSAACVADEDMVAKGASTYLVGVGAADEKPRNFERRCKAAWLSTPSRGPGALFLRHVGARSDFAFTPQKGEPEAPSATVMGPYLPASRLMSITEFEKNYCRAARAGKPRKH